MPYYGLYIPVKGGGATASGATSTNASGLGSAASSNGGGVAGLTKETETAESPFVFRTKTEALALLKQHKDARLKEFGEEEDAIKYAQTGFEIVHNKYNDVKTSTAALEKAAFRAPTKQELIEFRKIIEAGDYDRVKQIIWDNPRYLVSSGDTPSTLKEGYRYNAMHICALSKRPQIAELILKTVSDPKFVDLLTGKKNDEKMCLELCVNLLDYYLNIPEKGRSETPLHFASKYGCPEMVEVLTSYPECKMTPNSEGLLPKEIICGRVSSPKPEIVKKIESLFDERYYVPVFRCNDSSVPAQIGQPFSANDPPNLNCDPLTPEVEIKALAGPMSKDKAKKFFRRWKTPPRLGSNVSTPIANNPFISPMKSRNISPLPPGSPRSTAAASVGSVSNSTCHNSPTAMLQRRALFNSTPQGKDNTAIDVSVNGFDQSFILHDSLIGDEQNGNHDKENMQESLNKLETNNNHNLKPGLCPRTPLFKIKKEAFFLYREQNVASPLVGSIIEIQGEKDVLNCSDIYDSPGFKERHLKNTDTEKGIECIGRNLAKEQNVEWREYWDFLEEFVDIASEQGMQKLENYLGQRMGEYAMKFNKRIRHSSNMLEEVCFALEKFGFGSSAMVDAKKNTKNGEVQRSENDVRQFSSTVVATSSNTTTINQSTSHQSTTPYTYVEKSLQVHARRMTKTILYNIDNVVSINDALLLELRRVKSLICSFREDESYINVNFEKVHSRIGNLVSMFLINSQEITVSMKAKILKIFQNLMLTQGERREHIECVCTRILDMLEIQVDQVLPENLKTEEMCSKVWSEEKDCDCQWESNLSRKTSRRNRMEARYKNHQRMKQQERTAKKQFENVNLEDCATGYRVSTATGNESSDDAEDDVFWSDFGGSDSEDEEVWKTPPESPSGLSLSEEIEDDGYKTFIYGNEPTKRDLDVLNAIFHVEVDKAKHPTIHCWKTAIMRYSNDEMDFFPSPRVVKKTQNISCLGVVNKSDEMPQTPSSSHKPRQLIRSNTASLILTGSPKQHMTSSSSLLSLSQPVIRDPILQLPTAKRLFTSPGRAKTMTAMLPTKTTMEVNKQGVAASSAAKTPEPPAVPKVNQGFLTPLHKLRGLFSSYREQLDNSPLPATFSDCSSNDGSNNNLSLLNISASE